MVTSQQELHTFLKAAYSITITHKWLSTPQELVTKAAQTCQQALANFYDYSRASTQDKEDLCAEIMRLIGRVKVLLGVIPFPNSDKGSFIPDSYRNVKDSTVNFTLEAFSKIMQRFQKYHMSLCETTTRSCKRTKDETDGAKLCLTALETTAEMLFTECRTEVEQPQNKGSDPSSGHLPSDFDKCSTFESSDQLGSSWQRLSLSSPLPSGRGTNMSNQSCITTECDDVKSAKKKEKESPRDSDSGISSLAGPSSVVPSSFSCENPNDLGKSEFKQAGMETMDTEGDWMADIVQKQEDGVLHSLSQLTLKTSSSSLSDSFSSQSSWENISAGENFPIRGKLQPSHQSKTGMSRINKSVDSNESFFILETVDYEPSPPDLDATKNYQWKVSASSEPQHLESCNIYSNIETEVDPEPVKPATVNSPVAQYNASQCAITETSDSSFEMLEMDQNGHHLNKLTSTESMPQNKNPLCFNCLNHKTAAAITPIKQFLLSKQDYQTLLAGVCHECLLTRLYSDTTQFKLNSNNAAYSKFYFIFLDCLSLSLVYCILVATVVVRLMISGGCCILCKFILVLQNKLKTKACLLLAAFHI